MVIVAYAPAPPHPPPSLPASLLREVWKMKPLPAAPPPPHPSNDRVEAFDPASPLTSTMLSSKSLPPRGCMTK